MKINITEEEKRNILKMHKSLISEQVQTTGGGHTQMGGADKEYCSNLENKLQRELQDVAASGINVKDFVLKQPNHEKSFFGEFTFRAKAKQEYHQVVVCQSKKGEKINPYYFASTDGFKRINNGSAITSHTNLYPKMCERINTCVGFNSQPQS